MVAARADRRRADFFELAQCGPGSESGMNSRMGRNTEVQVLFPRRRHSAFFFSNRPSPGESRSVDSVT